jgi:type II secretory pathway pseudopilin PulG
LTTAARGPTVGREEAWGFFPFFLDSEISSVYYYTGTHVSVHSGQKISAAKGATMSHRGFRANRAFTVVEVVLVLAVVVTASGLIMPAVQQSREAADRTKTLNNLSHCAKAVHLSHDNNRKFPPYYGPYAAKAAAYSFHTHLLPYVDQGELYKQEAPDPEAVVAMFVSPMDATQTDKGAGAANYPVNLRLFYTKGGLGTLAIGDNLIYPRMPQTFQQDGTSNTLMFATKYQHCGKIGGSLWADTNAASSPTAATFGGSMALWQKAPKQAACNPTAGTAVSFTLPNIQLAMCDASVRNLSATVSAATWQAAQTPSAGDILGTDWND